MHFIGNVDVLDGLSVRQMAERAGVGAFYHGEASKPRHEAFRDLARASMLLSLPQDTDMAIPAKVYEYMLFRAWILALAEPGSATAGLLTGTAADVVQPRDIEGMAGVIERRYREFCAGAAPPRLADDPSLSRTAQAESLFQALDDIIGPPAVSAAAGSAVVS